MRLSCARCRATLQSRAESLPRGPSRLRALPSADPWRPTAPGVCFSCPSTRRKRPSACGGSATLEERLELLAAGTAEIKPDVVIIQEGVGALWGDGEDEAALSSPLPPGL